MKIEKRLNVDLLIAVAALLISTIAALASVYQTRIFATQLSATVWPYLSVHTDYPGDGSMTILLNNDGLGPALIRSASLSYDGKRVAGWSDVLNDFLRHAKHAQHGKAQISATGVDQSSIVRPGEGIKLLRLSSSQGDTVVIAERKRLRLKFCYCSIQNRCWTIDSEVQGHPPVDTASCPQNESIYVGPLDVR